MHQNSWICLARMLRKILKNILPGPRICGGEHGSPNPMVESQKTPSPSSPSSPLPLPSPPRGSWGNWLRPSSVAGSSVAARGSVDVASLLYLRQDNVQQMVQHAVIHALHQVHGGFLVHLCKSIRSSKVKRGSGNHKKLFSQPQAALFSTTSSAQCVQTDMARSVCEHHLLPALPGFLYEKASILYEPSL